jgi:hypothetical protein
MWGMFRVAILPVSRIEIMLVPVNYGIFVEKLDGIETEGADNLENGDLHHLISG